MKLIYDYLIRGYSGGMMLTNTTSGEWDFDSFDINQNLSNPNSEVIITVLEKGNDSVTINIVYRNNNQTLKILPNSDTRFTCDANAYGFTFIFKVKE